MRWARATGAVRECGGQLVCENRVLLPSFLGDQRLDRAAKPRIGALPAELDERNKQIRARHDFESSRLLSGILRWPRNALVLTVLRPRPPLRLNHSRRVSIGLRLFGADVLRRARAGTGHRLVFLIP